MSPVEKPATALAPQQQQRSQTPLFDGPYGVHPLHESSSQIRRQSPPLPSSDICTTSMAQNSQSVPGSRRNSNDNLADESGLCSVFDKLKVQEVAERRNSSPNAKYTEEFIKTATHRSMSVDVGSIHPKLPLSASSSSSTRYTSMLDNTSSPSNLQELLPKSYLLDNDPHKTDMHPFTASPNGPYLRRYAGSTERLSSLASKENSSYTGLFSSSSALDLTSAIRRHTARHNRSVESLRSKSWAQYLETAESAAAAASSPFSPLAAAAAVAAEDGLPNARAQAAYYGQPRRFSYGWPEMANGKANFIPRDVRLKHANSRLTTSHSYSDLHDAALRAYYNSQQQQQPINSPMHETMVSAAASVANDALDCPQYQQHGLCMLDDQCPYAHTNPSPILSHSLLQMDQLPATNPSSAQHPYLLGMPALPFYASSIYQHYSILNNLASGQFPPKPATTATMFNASSSTQRLSPSDLRPRRANSSTVSSPSAQAAEESNRFSGAKLEDFVGKMYDLCKDQNGCRFLQKKIEEPNRANLKLIFDEVQPYFVELMTEPFGNYLCQKLIEHCDDTQRDTLVDTVAPDLLKISLNMHGTRAVQKLVEFLSTPHQIQTVTEALKPNVVTLIKDLNGNHVIQKCLHRLSAEHKQFIYDAVSENCIQVATHRHGCCVLQRCIDYSSDAQKNQLVNVITWNALPLVQDPFGNYVVQYVLDLGDITYTDTLVRCFLEHVCDLSVQKFSSNVIEKCIRVAEPETRRLLVAELMDENNIEKLLRDSFANYVIQTCLEYADQDQRIKLVEAIRPLLPSIRSTPYGKRIHSKIQREQNSQAQQHQQRRIRHQQSMGSLRLASESGGSFGTQNTMYQSGGGSLAFGLPLIGSNDPLYPYP